MNLFYTIWDIVINCFIKLWSIEYTYLDLSWVQKCIQWQFELYWSIKQNKSFKKSKFIPKTIFSNYKTVMYFWAFYKKVILIALSSDTIIINEIAHAHIFSVVIGTSRQSLFDRRARRTPVAKYHCSKKRGTTACLTMVSDQCLILRATAINIQVLLFLILSLKCLHTEILCLKN